MENDHKIYYKGVMVLGVVLIATFFIYRGTVIAQTKSLKDQGLNEYIDPSKNSKYSQVYNEIIFKGDGITKEELDNINTIVNLKDNSSEEPEAIIEEEVIPISQIKTGQKIRSISYNSVEEDTKIAEINYYRGKDESLDTKKSKIKELKDQKEQNKEVQDVIVILDKEIIQQEQKIQKNKDNWDKKIKNKKSEIDLIKAKIQTTDSTNNKDLMDILYPSKESIDKLNNEILEERKKIKELGLDKIWKREELKQKIVSMLMPEVQAGSLNNFIADLIIYPRSSIGLRIDLKGNGVYNGNGFHLWTANGGNAQKFKFMDDSGEIKYAANTNFCLDRDRNEYRNGAKIQLYSCNGTEAQKWIAFPSGEIKPVNNQSFCLDASAGVAQGSTLHLWQCHGGDNQKFQIGEEDFGKFDYKVRLQSSKAGNTSGGSYGHTLISTMKIDVSSRFVHHTNTFSFYGTAVDSDSLNNGGKINNMNNRKNNNTWSNLMVDYGYDWGVSLYDEGREVGGFRTARYYTTKQASEEIRFMNGYKVDDYVNKGHFVPCQTCATYSAILWNTYHGTKTSENKVPPQIVLNCKTPGNIYDILASYQY
jgi:hypothetical protein